MTDNAPDEAQIDGFGDEVEEALRWQHRRNRRGHFVLSAELLARLINLPAGCEIMGIYPDPRVHGLMISFVSDDLPEIDENVISPMIPGNGELRLIPASQMPKPDPEREPEPDDVLFANVTFSFDHTQEPHA